MVHAMDFDNCPHCGYDGMHGADNCKECKKKALMAGVIADFREKARVAAHRVENPQVTLPVFPLLRILDLLDGKGE